MESFVTTMVKLTPVDLERIIIDLDELLLLRPQLIQAACDDNQEFLAQGPERLDWVSLYDQPFAVLVFVNIILISEFEDQAFSDLQCQLVQSFPVLKEVDLSSYTKYHLMGAVYALGKTIESIEKFGLPIDRLIKRARNGDEQALFKAIRLDHTVALHPVAARCLCIAELQADEEKGGFFSKLRNALSGRPNQSMVSHGKLRVILFFLHSLGQLDHLSEEQQIVLFSDRLDLFQDRGSDPKKTLARFIQRLKAEWRQEI